MDGRQLLCRSLSDIAKQIRRRDISPVEVTRALLEQLERLNPRLNAFIATFAGQALEAAQRAEREIANGQSRRLCMGCCWR